MYKYMHEKNSPFNYGDNGGGADYQASIFSLLCKGEIK
jgi:hypothetical protein|tara:strand:- start:567 stop:680 length:114 start_codon:yes stop_codon:yes gene_type:complete